MSQLGEYLLHLISACMIAAVARRILACSKEFSAIGNVIIGIFLIFSILSPVRNIDWNINAWQSFSAIDDFSNIAQDASVYQQEALQAYIKQETEAYIWSKAQSLSMDIQLDVSLGSQPPYAPVAITITGPASPYAKGQLTQFLSAELGIPKEAQIWIAKTS